MTTDMLTLSAFILERVTASEIATTAELALTTGSHESDPEEWPWVKRSRAECKAKRAIVKIHPGSTDGDECPGCGAWLDGQWKTGPGEICPTLSALASVYADDPAFNPAWAS